MADGDDTKRRWVAEQRLEFGGSHLGLGNGPFIAIDGDRNRLLVVLVRALCAPGRLDGRVYAATPGVKGRALILKIHTSRMPLAKDVDLAKIAAETERFTGADLEDVVRRAGLAAIRKHGGKAKTVNAADFADALKDSRATVSAEMEAEYAKIKGELKKQAAAMVPQQQIGFLAPGMVSSTRDKKHG